MAYELEDELEALPELEDELEDEGELEDEDEMEDEQEFGAIGNIIGGLLGEGEDEDELEDEGELEDELEDEVSPVRKIYPDAEMEHLGELASEAETEDEAVEHFLPLVGMAASKLLPVVAKAVAPGAKKILPKIARAVTKASPRLTRHIGKVARTLHRNPRTRHLLKVVPAIARKTVGSVAHQAARGRRVTPHTAVRTFSKHARRVLAHPAHRKHALRQHRRLEHKFHRRYGRGMRHLAGRWGRGRLWRGRYPHGRVRGALPAHHAGRGIVHRPGVGVPGHATVRRGRIVGGQCTCGPCPACGAAAGHGAAPAYCRCCGQVLR
jgi:hypothetical protein